ncbi:MAG: MaoC family dehydratase N-terminal domain-containing protein [Archangiaceae bacterium]|nr:MaoC family dehydratase N-terminal domain-containing protein [Archangiaceae bacterium]
MPPRKLYFENVRVGDEIPAMAKAPVDRVQLARYAGATGDFHPLHVDEAFAKTLGMPSVYAPSPLGQGFLGQLITDWARGAQIKKFSTKFIRLIWPGDTLVCKGRVSDRHGENGKYAIELDVWAENQKGELVLKGNTTLSVFYSSEDENRQKAGQPPVVVNVPRENILERAAEPPKKSAPKPAKPAKPAKPGKPAKAQKPAKAATKPKPAKPKPAPKKKKR